MKFTGAIFVALAATLVSAWEFDTGGNRIYRGNRDTPHCEQASQGRYDRNGGQKLRYKWNPDASPDTYSKCCTYLYTDDRCGQDRDNMAVERMCRYFDGEARRPFGSFRVVCHAKDVIDV
jgi:hypothetical protein